jgi:hypothetical protein
LAGFYGVSGEPAGSRTVACNGKAVSARFWSPGTKDTAGTVIQERELGFGSRSAPRAYFSGTSELPPALAGGLAGFVLPLKRDHSVPNRGIET